MTGSKKAGRVRVGALGIAALAVAAGCGTAKGGGADSLAGRYAGDFLVGTAVSARDFEDGERAALLRREFNAATAENAMKPMFLQPERGAFRFDEADALVNNVRDAGLAMHGHTLAWHEQTAAWMFEAGLSRGEALANLTGHARTVAAHFAGRVISWDVLNEAVSDTPVSGNWRASLRETPWFNFIGEEYIAAVFRAAREGDPGAKLYYNDYNLDRPDKAAAVCAMIKEINEQNTDAQGRLLIEGVGMQCHYSLSTNPENVEASVSLFTTLGVELAMSEIDVQADLDGDGKLSEAEAGMQARLYAAIFEVFRRHAEVIRRVTFWGMDDGSSWRSESFPLVFDAALQRKPAYAAILAPSLYLEKTSTSGASGAR